MRERAPNSAEVILTPEQQDLFELARSLTALSQATANEHTSRRPTTRREKVGVVLGRLFGARTEGEPRDAYHRTLQEHTTVRTLHLRDFRDEDAINKRIGDHLIYRGNGSIYLQQTHTLTPPSDVRTELEEAASRYPDM